MGNNNKVYHNNKKRILFKEYPILKPVPCQDKYELQDNLSIVYKDDQGDIKAVLIKKGFLTDGASIPSILWGIIGHPYQPQFITAAVVHDYMCENDYPVDLMSDLFFDLLVSEDVGMMKAFSMETAVRLYKTLF